MTDQQLGPPFGASGWNMYVFRDGRQAVSGPQLRSQLADAVRAVPVCADGERLAGNRASNQLIEALLRAGEIECALTDADDPGAQVFMPITDALAARLVGDPTAPPPIAVLAQLPTSIPPMLQVSPPEGFAYYALHPGDMAALAAEAPSRSHHVLVVGVRTIGVTLSAVVAAELHKCGKHARRITVRPDGHPYNRRTEFNDEQKRFISQYRNANADFLIVDEGPGMSGSSFLSVADALVAARVPRDRITLLCSREPDVAELRASNAQQRWSEHRAMHVRPNTFIPEDASIYVAGGIWRAHFLRSEAEWPASWLHMERLKFLSPDKHTLFKFEGFGRYGRAVHERSLCLRESGFGPESGTPEYGFGVYPVAAGRLMRPADLSRDMLVHLARYCAMRIREFSVNNGHAPRAMAQMTRFNYGEEFGRELDLADDALTSASTIIADARMQPHEWLRMEDGRVLKLDGAEHGDDHFFPGPTDIAWDLAGAIVEWQMDSEAQETLLREYRRASGDDAQPRIRPFMLAYASFRMGYNKMAAEAVRGSGEEHRLLAAYARYRDYLARLVQQPDVATVGIAAAAVPDAVTGTSAATSNDSRHSQQSPSISILDSPAPEPMAA